MEKKNPGWGGKRRGSGRPPTGRKQYGFRATEEEYKLIKKYIDEVRNRTDKGEHHDKDNA